MIDIRPLPEHLHDAAVALWQQTGVTRPWNDPHADLHRAATGSASTVLAAIDRDRLLGTAMVGHDGHRGWVYYLAVTPGEQRRGLGRRLMQECEQWVRARNTRRSSSWCARTTPPPPPSTNDSATPTPRSPSSVDAWTAPSRSRWLLTREP